MYSSEHCRPYLCERHSLPFDLAWADSIKDDGPWIYLNDIVDTLDKAGAKGTFFFSQSLRLVAGLDRR